jgi:hypothetical protein
MKNTKKEKKKEKKCFKKVEQKRKDKKRQIKKKKKIKSGVACDPLITKRKNLSFGRFTKENKKDLQVKSPP